jgi:carbamoyl-phosphate synthase/aspartate carbamoyltransferase/dihydroorotase
MADLFLPGLVDVHTHLRVPGGEQKEDFSTGTAAALAGGITTLLAMPNTSPALSKPEILKGARETARKSIRNDVGLFAGASSENINMLIECSPYAVALKIYLNDTFGPLRVEALDTLNACFEQWPKEKVIAMHAEGQSLAVGIGLAASYNRSVHFCHISRQDEVELIAEAKSRGLAVTAEVTPHHLFLTEEDAQLLGPLGDMRPRLASAADVAALWNHINDTIDCVATDHAPHTLSEKYSADSPPGVPGLQTSLSLMMTAVQEGRLSLRRLTELMAGNPRQIFNLPEQEETWVEIDTDARYTIKNETMKSKCGWTPFDGMTVHGRVKRVVLRGQTVCEDGRVLAVPGSGSLLPVENNNG